MDTLGLGRDLIVVATDDNVWCACVCRGRCVRRRQEQDRDGAARHGQGAVAGTVIPYPLTLIRILALLLTLMLILVLHSVLHTSLPLTLAMHTHTA